MSALFQPIRLALVTLMLMVSMALVAPAGAQQPTSVNPTASSVKEDQLLQQLKIISGRGSLPDTKSYNLEQPEGRAWREFHEHTLPIIGGVAIFGMLLVLVVFYLVRGSLKLENGRSGRTVTRFNAFERFVHWMTAGCFIILGLSGLNISFGKDLLLPLIGAESFATWSQWAKYAHNYLSFPFTIGVVLVLLLWVAWSIPNRVDVNWLMEGGGVLAGKDPPAERFNAGQKGIYWIVVLGGGAMAATGYLLMFPFYLTDVAGMQIAQMIHGAVAVLFVAAMLGHIYLGTIGVEGAFEGMGTGEVDLNWAKQHHRLWLENEVAKGRGATPPAGASTTPAQ